MDMKLLPLTSQVPSPKNIVAFIIREGHWQFFTDANFQSQTGPRSLGPGTYPSVTAVGIPDSAISSVKLVSG